MKNSSERIEFITDYIVSYESKIKALNSKGLFDSAKLFELFAIGVCNLWFNRTFTNLNDQSPNYPGVDLVSDNNEIFIQVSTVQDIPSKISRTLNMVKENKTNKLSNVKNVYFFVLNNDSVDKAKDYTGINRIGDVDFEVNKHLISTQTIITRATSDLDFQIKLYDLLAKENTKVRSISEKLFSVFENSKTIGLKDIDCLINGEYEIDRTNIINKIRNSNHQFISVRGEAGSGKSVVCKKVVENEPYLLYARAERFTEETDINEIWHLDIEYALKYLGDKPIFFFIDSLEFISEAYKTKLDLLKNLYELVKKYPNSKIITSCRTIDSSAFLQIDSIYSIDIYYVEELTLEEVYAIAKKYPVINAFKSDNSYLDLIKSPFYINLIVRNITVQTNIDDENKLRNFIWENVICLKEKANNYNLRFDEISKEIRKIVLDRAKSFSVGIDKESINSLILHALLSEGIAIENDCSVRLKYDIFEDICFEKIIDKQFDVCKGNYNTFFSSVENLGRGCYRRYQIWISNKLLSKVNRDKFIYKLIFTKDLSEKWIKQTLIGLTKSKFCTSFFREQCADIIKKGMISKFINITNLYAFEPKIQYVKEQSFVLLTPNGSGRSDLIRIVYDNNLFLNSTVDSDAIIKLCSDYSNEQNYDSETAVKACYILQHYIDTELLIDKKYYYSSEKIITPLLIPIYQMSKFSKDWIVSFWKSQKKHFVSNDHQLHCLAKEIIEYTLKFTTINLVKNLPNELCELANTYWMSDLNNSHLFYGSQYDSYCYKFGLNKYADNYEHSLDSLNKYSFFRNLIDCNFWIGFRWAIDFINKAVINLSTFKDSGVDKIAIKFFKTGLVKQYYANSNMWYAGTEEYKIPALISDMVYLLKNKIISLIKIAIKCNYNFKTFANNIKEYIFNFSNNIVMFSMIEDIGIEFEKELPGFALDLATCINLVMWDISRFVSLNPGADSIKLRKNILTVVGLPNLKDRYTENSKIKFTLLDYVAHMQFIDVTKERCYNILDYLYSIYPNEANTAYEHLQIQKMDMRNSKTKRIDDDIVAISPIITGEAKKIVENHINNNLHLTKVEKVITDFLDAFDFNDYSLDSVRNIIDYLKSEICDVGRSVKFQNILITLIVLALNKPELDSKTRSEYCNVWLTGVENILNNGSFIFEYNYLSVLFRQIGSNVKPEINQRIKVLVLNLIMFDGNNGLIHELGRIAQCYLETNTKLSVALFNTIVMLSKDEMEYQKYTYSNVVSIDRETVDKFIPNKMPKYYEYDYMVLSDTKKGYSRCRDEIIEKYLFNQEELDLSDFLITNYDIDMLCNIVNCGLTTQNEVYVHVLQEVVRCVLEIVNSTDMECSRYDIVTVHSSFNLSDYLGKELLNDSNCILDILFKDIDFNTFRREAVEFYLRTFNGLLPIYVDAYDDSEKRGKCETILIALEEKINNITCSKYIQKELYRALFMSVNGYEGDWSKVKTDYSYKDIEFLNRMFSKYGKYNFKFFMHTINKMKLEKLLPNILPSINTTLESFISKEFFDRSDYESVKYIISHLITLCFMDFNEEIKADEELVNAYEGILEKLTTLNSEEAAVLLDEFRIH